MAPNQIIKRKRIAKGLGVQQVAALTGLSVHEYEDIEQHADEALGVVHLNKLKAVCAVLGLDLLSLSGTTCAFCEGRADRDNWQSPRNIVIQRAREHLGLSKVELGDRIGFEEQAIVDMEQDPDYLEKWSVELIQELASILGVPIEVLLRYPCGNCGPFDA